MGRRRGRTKTVDVPLQMLRCRGTDLCRQTRCFKNSSSTKVTDVIKTTHITECNTGNVLQLKQHCLAVGCHIQTRTEVLAECKPPPCISWLSSWQIVLFFCFVFVLFCFFYSSVFICLLFMSMLLPYVMINKHYHIITCNLKQITELS